MKKIFYFFALFVCIGIIGCSDSEDNPNQTNPTDTNSEDTACISKNFIPIDWSKTELLSYDESKRKCVLSLSDESKLLREGNIISVVNDTCNRILIINGVEIDGKSVILYALEGDLCDIFANTSLKLSTVDDSRNERLGRSSKEMLIKIEKVEIVDEDGVKEVASRSPEYGSTHLTGKLWKWENDKEDIPILESGNGKIYIEKPEYSADLDLDMELNFGGRNIKEILVNGRERWRSKTTEVKACLVGKIHTKTVVKAEINASTEFREDDDELFIHNIFKPIRVTFNVSGVPVVVTLSADMFRGASISALGQLTERVGYENDLTCSFGQVWKEQDKSLKPIHSFDYQHKVIGPDTEGKGSIDGRVWAFPRIYVEVYGIGMAFDVKPYVGVELSGGFGMDRDALDWNAWNLRGYAGIDVSSALSQKYMNYEIFHKELATAKLLEFDLFRIPESITAVPSGVASFDFDTPREVEFEIFDYNLFKGKTRTSLPVSVQFDANGQLSSNSTTVSNGKATVTWTPASQDDILTATIYRADGSIIDECSVDVDLKEREPNEHKEIFDNDIKYVSVKNNVYFASSSGCVPIIGVGCVPPRSEFDKFEQYSLSIYQSARPQEFDLEDEFILLESQRWMNMVETSTFKGDYSCGIQIFPEYMNLDYSNYVATSYLSLSLHYRSDLTKYETEPVYTKFVYSRKPKLSVFGLHKTEEGYKFMIKQDGALWFGSNPEITDGDHKGHIVYSLVGENFQNNRYFYIDGPISYSDNWVSDGITEWNIPAMDSRLLMHDMMPSILYYRAYVNGKEIQSNKLHISWDKEKHKIISLSY